MAKHSALPSAPPVFGAQFRLDAAESAFVERDLEHKLALARDVKYADSEARRFIPVNNEGGAAETILYEENDYVGEAKIVSNYADDVPMVNSKTAERRQAVKTIADGFQYNIQEIKAAAQANRPLNDRYVTAARRVIETKLDHLAAFGDAASGIPGFLRRSDTLTETIPNDGTGSSKKWSAKTADLIIRDVNLLVAKMVNATNNVEKPDTLLLPLDAYAFAASTPRASTSDTTILQFILASNPWIKDIQPWNRLSLAGGSLDTTRAVLYRRSPEVLELHVPEEFSMLPPQPHNLAFKVPCTLRTGGVVVGYPKAIVYGDGV